MRAFLFTLLSILFSIPSIVAQEHLNCGTQQLIDAKWEQNPHLEKEWKNTFAGNVEKEDDTTIFIIPVVFHILHEYGIENISDAQVQSAIDVLNRDYRLLNNDTSDVIQDFKHLYADAKIEFRLARLDPDGNCTNGIDRIYTHLTNNADDYSKINQWNRAHYLNIWVVKTIGQAGISGYAYYPNVTNGTMLNIDGVLMLNQYVGNVGTGSVNTSRFLGHEIAHYLNLPHPNETIIDTSTGCGDDGIADTPITAGAYYNCNMVGPWDDCTPGINENFQNYMELSYCTRMFTIGQVAHMRAALQNTHGQRNELTTPQTHAATGIDVTLPCVPIADFNAINKTPCVGTLVSFGNESYNAPVTTYEWTFQDGVPSTSSEVNPTVTFSSPGFKIVTLTVENSSGSHTIEKAQYIRVADNWADFTGPKLFDLNNANSHPEWFHIENPGDNWAKFHYSATNGKGGGGCFKLNNYKNVSGLPITHPDANYYQQLGESKDMLITPSFDLRFTSGATLTFDYSYASGANTVADIAEQLVVSYSKDCGVTWTNMGGSALLTGAALLSGGFASNTDFVPTSDNQWATKTINLSAGALAAKTMFKFTFTASDKSNNLYIDNINIQGTGFAGLNDFGINNELVISPNPVVSGNSLKVEYLASNDPVTFILRNLQGAEVMRIVRNETNQLVSFDLEIGNQLPASYYFLEVKSASALTVQKIVVVKQ